MASHIPSITLTALPADVHKLIVSNLKTTTPLFIPKYTAHDRLGDLRRKSKEYYGAPTKAQVACSTGLLAWSATCKYFHSLIAPDVHETVVLRSKTKSVRSIKALMVSQNWRYVRELIFAATSQDGEEGLRGYVGTEREERIKSEMKELYSILCDLPPNVRSLTLDFPQNWDKEPDYVVHYSYDDEAVKKAERILRFRALLATVFEAVGDSESTGRDIELKLYNVPPTRCSGWENSRLSKFLQHVSSFTMSLCHFSDGNGWNLSTSLTPLPMFLCDLETNFYSHLANVRTFKLHADHSWPLGVMPGNNHLPMPLPRMQEKLSKVKHLSFQQIFISEELIQFLVMHAHNLESIELTDCFAHGEGEYTMVPSAPTWSQLFTTLADAQPESLISVNVSNPAKKMLKLLEQYEHDDRTLAEDDVAQVAGILHKQRSEEAALYKQAAQQADVRRRRRRIFSYCTLHWEYGELLDDAVTNVAEFLSGRDHDAYLKLIKVVEENNDQNKPR